jgi:hypothetical protein
VSHRWTLTAAFGLGDREFRGFLQSYFDEIQGSRRHPLLLLLLPGWEGGVTGMLLLLLLLLFHVPLSLSLSFSFFALSMLLAH